jgi:glycosyltransferase involved in cell wall biosynthesis
MNAFTGGCHYSTGCRKFEKQCGACPQLGSSEDTDLSRTVWKRKRKAYRSSVKDSLLHIVTPSEWLAQEARRSTLFYDVPVHVIPNGIDANTYRPRNTQGLRRALEIPQSHRVVLFVAGYGARRKGFDLLAGALGELRADKATLVSIGSDLPDVDTSLPHQHLGEVTSDVLLSVLYSFADLFVIPSRQDNLPNTVLEAMACGTPVVGFDTGGIPDMVRPGETGWLAKKGNVRGLREKIDTALNNRQDRVRMGGRCREVVESEYTLDTQAEAYRRLYENIMGEGDQ